MLPTERKKPQIPIPTTFIACLESNREQEIDELLQTILSTDSAFLIWKSPIHDQSAQWSLAMERMVTRHINGRKFENVRSLFMVKAPHDTRQARTLSGICSHARIVYVGQDPVSLTNNHRHRGIMTAIKQMEAFNHPCEIIDPATDTVEIVSRILNLAGTGGYAPHKHSTYGAQHPAVLSSR